MDKYHLPVESIRERDIDLLLLEELSVDFGFARWFAVELGLPVPDSVNGAWRSISDFGLGETDIMFSYTAADSTVLILIENKLDAPFQPTQFERYRKRAADYVERQSCSDAYPVLVAPAVYTANQNLFDRVITYEQIAGYLKTLGTLRSSFRGDLLIMASEKMRRGYQPVNSEIVQQFWLSYWHYKEINHASLVMKKPAIVPHQSDWPMLSDPRLKHVVFYHKWAQGYVDVNFHGFAEALKNIVSAILPSDALIEEHAKSFSIRLITPRVDRTKRFEEQIDQVSSGLKAMERIADLLANVRDLDVTKYRLQHRSG